MTVAAVDGEAIGHATRERARESGRPVGYQVVIELGWYWAAAAGSVPHLVPPYGDEAKCGRHLTRADRQPVRTGIAQRGCRRCMHAVGIDLSPTTTRS